MGSLQIQLLDVAHASDMTISLFDKKHHICAFRTYSNLIDTNWAGRPAWQSLSIKIAMTHRMHKMTENIEEVATENFSKVISSLYFVILISLKLLEIRKILLSHLPVA